MGGVKRMLPWDDWEKKEEPNEEEEWTVWGEE